MTRIFIPPSWSISQSWSLLEFQLLDVCLYPGLPTVLWTPYVSKCVRYSIRSLIDGPPVTITPAGSRTFNDYKWSEKTMEKKMAWTLYKERAGSLSTPRGSVITPATIFRHQLHGNMALSCSKSVQTSKSQFQSIPFKHIKLKISSLWSIFSQVVPKQICRSAFPVFDRFKRKFLEEAAWIKNHEEINLVGKRERRKLCFPIKMSGHWWEFI